VLETRIFKEVVSVNASKLLFCVTVIHTKNMEEGAKDAILGVLCGIRLGIHSLMELASCAQTTTSLLSYSLIRAIRTRKSTTSL
jgi:hypothetical protein